jgi:exodeoxyribonuclease V beta subunit
LASGPAGVATTPDKQKLAHDMHLFPRGAHAGNFFHHLFEVLDYRQTRRSQAWGDQVAAEVVLRGFERKWVTPVMGLIRDVLATPLPATAPSLALNLLAPQACVKELAFVFPLSDIDPDRLTAVFDRHDLSLPRDVIDHQLQRLDFIISGGFLRGFIDLVFRWQDRYYLVDWKSNWLGDTYADYAADRINAVMVEDYYFLQYHLYVLALDQFLRQRLPTYAYERDFGGVYYLFIRGVRSNRNAASGIFYDRPQAGLLRDLRRLLLKKGTHK